MNGMIKVRDLTKSPTDYKGRLTWAVAKDCPCCPCWNPHDCGYLNSQGKWVKDVWCLTNYQTGCPRTDLKPVHVYVPRGRKCRRCGESKPKKEAQ